MRSKDWRCRASHSGEIVLAGSRRLRSTLAAAPVLFAHAVLTASVSRIFATANTKRFLQSMHALKGLACRARVTSASSYATLASPFFAHAVLTTSANRTSANPSYLPHTLHEHCMHCIHFCLRWVRIRGQVYWLSHHNPVKHTRKQVKVGDLGPQCT